MEVLTEVEPEAICVECKSPFMFANSRAVKTRDSVLYCSPKCEAGLNIEGQRRALERAVIEAAKKWVGFYNGSSEFFSDTKLADEINALIEFETNQQQVKK